MSIAKPPPPSSSLPSLDPPDRRVTDLSKEIATGALYTPIPKGFFENAGTSPESGSDQLERTVHNAGSLGSLLDTRTILASASTEKAVQVGLL